MPAFVFPEQSNALAKQHLTPKTIAELAPLKTDTGFTLSKAIASGVENADSSIGIYAGDCYAYTLFAKIFDPIICEYHKTDLKKKQPRKIEPLSLNNPDPGNHFVRSTRIRVARNLSGFCFPCHIQPEDRNAVEKTVVKALNCLPQQLAGTYYGLEHISHKKYCQMKKENLLFEKGDRFQDAAGFNADYPQGRGVFLSSDRHFRVWLNEEDHLRIIGMEKTADISQVYNRLATGLKTLESELEFAWKDTHGYLASCPTNIGTAMRAGVHIQLKKLASRKNKKRLHDIVDTHHLQIRGTCGEKTAVENAVFDISNTQRLGISHADILYRLHAGVTALIQAEKNL